MYLLINNTLFKLSVQNGDRDAYGVNFQPKNVESTTKLK